MERGLLVRLEDRDYQYFDGVYIYVCAILCKTKEICKLEFEEVLSMKRWLSILAVFGCIVALSGCKNENEKEIP